MKWVFLLLIIGLIGPLSAWLRQNPRNAPKIWWVMGFMPFVMGPWHLYVAPISWAMWTGSVKGLEVSLLDALAVAVLLSSPRLTKLPFKWFFIAFIASALVSVTQTRVPMASFFYFWQLLRVFLLFAAVVKIAQDDRGPPALLSGMVAGLCLQVFYAGLEYAGGAVQTGGSFGHQNLLGMVTHFAVFPSLALLLAGNKGWAPKLAPVAGAIIVILGASRATIGLAGGGYVALLLLSAWRKWTPRKGAILGMGMVGLAIAAPLAMSTLDRRFASTPLIEGYDERAAFEKAAKLMLADHPLGIGANMYVTVANTQGYSSRAGVIPTFGSRSAPVHHAYLLTAAEMGYFGLIALVALLARLMFVAFRVSWRNRKDERGDVMLGLGVAVAVVAVHCLFEWVFVTYVVQYMLAMDAGLIAGLALKLGYWGPAAKAQGRSVRPQRTRPVRAADELAVPRSSRTLR